MAPSAVSQMDPSEMTLNPRENEDDEVDRDYFTRFKVMYSKQVVQNENEPLKEAELNQLRRKEKGLKDFCRLRIF